MTAAAPLGRIITFYSYKGGTGRSMALANLAWILACHGRRVLAVDWDLEAPGLHRYFRPFLLDEELTASEGLIDLVDTYATRAIAPAADDSKPPANWYLEYADYSPLKLSLNFGHFPPGGKIDLLPSGRQTDAYGLKVSSFNWQNLYDRLGGGGFFEAIKARMRREYDYVLIDSRTGVSDTTGICSVQMPDTLVVCFTLNNQSIRGSAAIAASALKQHEKLIREVLETQRLRAEQAGDPSVIADTPRTLRVFPIPMRVDSGDIDRLAIRQAFARQAFAEFVSHLGSDVHSYWGAVEVPHRIYYSYEEVLAALKDDPVDPKTVLAAFVRIARFITDGDVVDYRPTITSEERQKYLEAFAQTAPVTSPRQRVEAVPETTEEALLRTAETALGELGDDGKAIAFRTLSRLVKLGRSDEGGGLFAIRVPIADFRDEERRVISLLAQRGLLIVTSETRTLPQSAQTRSGQTILLGTQRAPNRLEQTVALADGRLPKLWPWFESALMADQEFLLWRQQLRNYLADWERGERESQALLSGRVLSEAEHWMLRRRDDLNAAESEYILASRAAEASRRSGSERSAAGVDERRRTDSRRAPMPPSPRMAASQTWMRGIATASVVGLFAAGYKFVFAPARERTLARTDYAARITAAVGIADPTQRAAALAALASTAPAFVSDLPIPAVTAAKADTAVQLPSLVLRGSTRRSEDLQFDARGEWVGSAFSDGAVWLWRLPDGASTTLDAQDGVALSIAIDSSRLSVGYANGRIRLWDTRSGGKVLFVGDTKSGPVHQVTLEKLDGQDWLLTSSEDGSIGLWSLGKLDSRVYHSSAQRARGTGPLAPWDDVRLRVADRKLVAASSVHGFEIWDAERSVAFGRPPNQKLAGLFATLAHKVERPPAVAISPSGNTLAFASQTPGAAVLVIGTLDGEVDEIDTPYPALNLAILDWISVGMAPNRAPFAHVRLAVERRDGGAGDAPQPRGMLQFQMLPGRVSQLSLSRDGKRFLGVLEDRIAVWYVDRPELPPDLLFVEANPVRARFAPDSIRVVSAHADGAVRIWDLSKQQQWPTTLKDAQVFARHLGECLRPPARIAVLGENSNDASNSYASCEDRQGRRGIESTRGR